MISDIARQYGEGDDPIRYLIGNTAGERTHVPDERSGSTPASGLAERTHTTRRKAAVERLGRRLLEARIALQLSQEEVAARAGITVATYGSLERGWTPRGAIANPTLDTLLRVMTVLPL